MKAVLSATMLALFASLVLVGCLQVGPAYSGPQATISPSLATKSPVPVAGRLARGAVNGSVVIVEYSDFQCPFCARGAETMERVLQAYPGKVALVFKHLPLPALHPYALKAAEAFECAADQGRAWEMHDKMFRVQPALDTPSLKRYARELGMDGASFDSCLDSGRKASLVNDDMAEAARLNLESTPTFFVNNKRLVGAHPFEAFKQVIDGELAGAA